MGTLDSGTGSNVKRKIAVVDITGNTATQIENAFNTNYGQKGWRVIQVVVVGAKTFLLAEKEV
mgnify:CR=1 FL=1